MWSPGSGRVHASGWVSSLSESTLTKSCQLSNCQQAIWVRQHLSEEFSLSTHQETNTSNPIGLTNAQQFLKVEKNWSYGWINKRTMPCPLLNFPSAIERGLESLTWQTTPLTNYLAPFIFPPSRCFILQQCLLNHFIFTTISSAFWTPKVCFIMPFPKIPFSLFQPPQ